MKNKTINNADNKNKIKILEIVLDQDDVKALIKEAGPELKTLINGCSIRCILDEIFENVTKIYERDINKLTNKTFIKQILYCYLKMTNRIVVMEEETKEDFTEDIVDQYYKEIKDFPVLSDEEVIELAKRKDAGDKVALETLIKHNLKLVTSCYGKYRGKGLSDADLLQEGNMGLMKAAQSYDYKKGNKFSSYAYTCIKNEMMRALTDNGRIPVKAYEDGVKIRKFTYEFKELNGCEPSISEIAKNLNLTEERVQSIIIGSTPLISLDIEIGTEGQEKTLLSIIKDEDIDDFADKIISDDLKEVFIKVLANPMFTKREREVIIMRFGLFNNKPETFERVGQELNISRQTIQKTESRALRKLRLPENANKLKKFIKD